MVPYSRTRFSFGLFFAGPWWSESIHCLPSTNARNSEWFLENDVAFQNKGEKSLNFFYHICVKHISNIFHAVQCTANIQEGSRNDGLNLKDQTCHSFCLCKVCKVVVLSANYISDQQSNLTRISAYQMGSCRMVWERYAARDNIISKWCNLTTNSI